MLTRKALRGWSGARGSYEPSPARRGRRARAEIAAVERAIYATLEADHPQTLCGPFYQVVSQGIVLRTSWLRGTSQRDPSRRRDDF